jgi:alkylhydroperoxidase/carboxymuconolactone decarboxylase family protein YurZ
VRQWSEVLKQYAPALYKEWRATSEATFKRGKVSEKLKHLVWLAVDSVVTHLYAPGAVMHAEQALEHGATIGEVMDTLRLACLPSTRGLQNGYEFLAAELAASAKPPPPKSWAELATELSPDFKRAFDALIEGESPGGLDARNRCLVTLAILSNPATADREGTRLAVKQAVKLGVSSDEIIEVMELGAMIRAHAFSNVLDSIGGALARHSTK